MLVRVAASEAGELFALLQKHASTSTAALELLTLDAFVAVVFAPAFYFWWCDGDARKAVVHISGYDPQTRTAEFGAIALKPRCGYGRRATLDLLAFGFNSMGLHRMWCKINADNVYCLASMKRLCGLPLRKEGTLRATRFKGGEFVDQHVYGIIEEEYRQWAK